MNGFTSKTLAALLLTSGVASAAGSAYRDIVDPCYPERYQSMARQEVHAFLAAQVQNGHVLDQTVWNSYFEPYTDHLTPAGTAHLAYLARRRPAPDSVVYIQEAQDVPGGFEPEHPNKYVEARSQLDAKRVQAVQRYLESYTAGRGQLFTVLLHDPPEVGASGVEYSVVMQKSNLAPPDQILVIYGGIHSTGGR